MNLLDENIEATRFVMDLSERADSMRLFPEERFKHIIGGVLMTTTVDTHGDQFALEALEGLVSKDPHP